MLGILLTCSRPKVDGWTGLLSRRRPARVVSRFDRAELWVLAPLFAAAWLWPEEQSALARRFRQPLDSIGGDDARRSPPRSRHSGGSISGDGMGMVPPNCGLLRRCARRSWPARFWPWWSRECSVFSFFPSFCGGAHGRGLFLAIVAALIGLIGGALPFTSYSVPAGRFGGAWHAVPLFPVIKGHSLVIIALTGLGGAVVTLWLTRLSTRERWIWTAAALGFGVAQFASHGAYQRFDEPLVLIAAALSAARFTRAAPRWMLAGPALLALLLAVIAALSQH